MAWVVLCRNIAAIKPDFMPEEAEHPYPLVVVPSSGASIRITFPADRRANRLDPDATMTVMLTIDEGGQPYKLPYIGNAANVVTVEGH